MSGEIVAAIILGLFGVFFIWCVAVLIFFSIKKPTKKQIKKYGLNKDIF